MKSSHDFGRDKKNSDGLSRRCKSCRNSESRHFYHLNKKKVLQTMHAYKERIKVECPERNLWHHAKMRAKKTGITFDLSPKDIHIPEVCPLLGIGLKVNKGHVGPNSPSLDRIDPSKGYTKDNVWVISHKANRIKNDATSAELVHIGQTLSQLFPHLSNAPN